MLVRSAGRRQRQRTSNILAASFAQLQLPWLAPAQLRWSASQAALPTNSPSRTRRKADIAPVLQAKAQARHLATASDQLTLSANPQLPPPIYSNGFRNSADQNVPWDTAAQRSKERDPTHSSLASLRPYDDPIIINSTTQDPAKLIKVQLGIHGTTAELIQHLHTSLRIGRFNRVEAIIQRLAEQSASFAPELLHAHTAYLEEHLRTLASQEKGSMEFNRTRKTMQRWFEVEVRQKNIQPDAKMLVVMIRAAIRAFEGKERERTVRRYADWAESLGDETLFAVLEAEDYDDHEYTILGPITLDYFEDEPHPVAEAMAPQAQAIIDPPPKYHPRTDKVDLADLPTVMATEQKGTGLESVQKAIKEFIDLPQLPTDAPLEAQRERAFERQRRLEESSVEIAIERWREADTDLRKIGISTAMQSRPMGALMWQWYRALLPTLKKEMAEIKVLLASDKAKDDDRLHYGPFLELLPPDKVAANTILWMMSLIARGKDRDSGNYENDVKFTHAATGLGKQLEAEAYAEVSKKAMKEKKQAKGQDNSKRMRRPNHKHSKAPDQAVDGSEATAWPIAPKVKLGAMLVQRLIETAQLPVTREHPRTKEKITQMQPAFLHRIKYVLGKKYGYVTPNPALLHKLESEPIGSLIAKRMPMVVEPKPWSGWNQGGYLHYPTPILRLAPGDKSGRDYFVAANRKGDMKQLYAGLTALGKVPWKVHTGVLQVQLEAWNSGEEVANFAPLHPNLPVPPEPESGAAPSVKRRYVLEMRDLENKRRGTHSKRCFQNFQLEIARAVANETLYMPHNLDFRGRAYPIPPYLNHMGADNVRGLLVFAEGKPLGEMGLRWLKIHLATVAGNDKVSMEDRVQFTMEHLDDIRDSVHNPLNGRKWWQQSEDAWQTLAACFELTEALDCEDPTQYVSHIPIQQDGTCNGLQHYAALGGDQIGARQVNLEPGDKPADVYTAVAEAVKLEVAKDAEAGNPIAQRLHGRITRKCVKQPVMTNVYGVTFYGAKEQVHRQLEILFPEVSRFDDVNLGRMSHYVAQKIFKSLGEMFKGAQAIQHWLGQCADRIATCLTAEQVKQLSGADGREVLEEAHERASKKRIAGQKRAKKVKEAKEGVVEEEQKKGKKVLGGGSGDTAMRNEIRPLFRSTVVWTTPLRLPVVQPYRKSRTREVRTNLQTIALQEPQVWDPVSKRKQLQAFPPNFIHSLDATHMLLCALKSSEVDMTFASIHDSFWTHACDIDRLSVLLRDAFVEMHKENIIGRLREEFQMRYKGCMYLASVVAKSQVGTKIAKWRKEMRGNGAGRAGELALEAERMRLLGSEDGEERAKGEAMVTPGSIMENEGTAESLMAPSEMSGHALGEVPEGAVEYEATNTDADDMGAASAEDAAEAAESPAGIVGGSAMNADADDIEDSAKAEEDDDEEDDEARKLKARRAHLRKTYPRKTYVWLPMAFPEIPPKGEFDVTRLKASRYFFH